MGWYEKYLQPAPVGCVAAIYPAEMAKILSRSITAFTFFFDGEGCLLLMISILFFFVAMNCKCFHCRDVSIS
jgi:hypothetical protein